MGKDHLVRDASITLLAMFFLAGLQIPAPLITMSIVDSATSVHPQLASIPYLAACAISLFLVTQGVKAIQRIALESFRTRVTASVQQTLLAAFMKLPWLYHVRTGHGSLLAQLNEDSRQLETLLADAALTGINDLLTLLVGIGLIFYINFQLALLAFVSIPISAFFVFRLKRGLKGKLLRLHESVADLSSFVAEALSNILTVKTLTIEPAVVSRHSDIINDVRKQKLSFMKDRVVYEALVTCCSGLTPILLLWYAAFAIARHALSVGELVAFLGYLGYLYRPTDSLVISVLSLQSALSAFERAQDLLGRPTEAGLFETKGQLASPDSPLSIVFTRVCFRYDDTADLVLRDVSLAIEPGSITGIIGGSGSGKTTLVNMIPGLLFPTSGVLAIKGIAYKSLQQLREQVAVVSQDTLLLSGTVYSNITLANELASQREVQLAADAACVSEFASSWSSGLEIKVTENGRSLSAGQRQRVMLARAILRKPKILILDEALSCVDLDTESRIMKKIRTLGIPIIVVISHRESISDHADRLYRLVDGRLVEESVSEKRAFVKTEWRSSSQDVVANGNSKSLFGLTSC